MATFCDLIVGRWSVRYRGRVLPCAVGRGGIGVKRREGDGITPIGTFRLTSVIQRVDRTRPLFGATPCTHDLIWSDDPRDAAYNTALRNRAHDHSHERLFRADPLYDLIGVLDYNSDPVVRGAGSAIFLHQWRKPRHPTEGCVAFSRANLRYVLETWTPRSRVIIRP